jgi:hypothetical protein
MAPRERKAAQGVSPEARAEIAQVKLDPELFICVLEDLADAMALPRRERPDVIEAALLSYCDFYGLDPDAKLTPRQAMNMSALASRLSALMSLADRVPPTGDPERYQAIAEAACTARLIDQDGKPAFQLLDFLGALGRAEQRRQG